MSYKTIHTDFRNDYTNARDALLNEGIVEIGHVQYERQKGLIIRPAYEIEGEIYFFSGMKAVRNTIYSVQLRPFNELKEADYIPLEEKSCITV
ncbi:hypothetical protein COM24_32880 [Bacillus toyonensis]|uniref:Uncharacterized protein n=1 Tax=Bacillus toyonensis TaxID=155322 RepID=A0AAP8EYK7_9BACI|nr:MULTISPECIES: hypothetical protein [Bacillus]MED3485430.1 hypothetical protein [Bacillus toyonensis]PEB89516.1 hypothetical protein CON81_30320 [Bacillus toyonensis]PEF77839.1 hypothetical protein CON80_29075 [Bacillus toyonensis]PEK97843.1 hypothetical protein CN606_29280 [Bacillus toyonensis]PEO23949.1 hypothetical protein CN589_30775 [Bacillus toyonensis]